MIPNCAEFYETHQLQGNIGTMQSLIVATQAKYNRQKIPHHMTAASFLRKTHCITVYLSRLTG
uniref:Uncharacterized protein n=1 Tax=mine drainage metagenome TaxID=410659 RepID=E6QUV2_9ZZZZ